MRILVIGGTGFIGYATVKRLSEQGHDITVFHRGKTEDDVPATVQHIHTERDERPIRFSSTDREAFRQFAPDIVLHMMLLGEQDAQDTLNTFNGIARRLVAISSQDVYAAFGRVNRHQDGLPEPLPITEDSPLRSKLYLYRRNPPREPDDSQFWMDSYEKILAERLLLNASGIQTTVLRLPMVYGPRDPQHRLFPYLKRMDDGRPAIILDENFARWRWTHGYVENVAAAIALAVTNERASGRVYNVGEHITVSQAEWIQQIGNIAQWNGHLVIEPAARMPAQLMDAMWNMWGTNTDQDIVVDSSRIRKELGYTEVVPLDEALRRTIAWERAHPLTEVDPKAFDYAAEDAVLANL